jgi:transposase
MAATVIDPGQFKSGRDLAAWIGLVPKQYSTGGKARLGGISKQGELASQEMVYEAVSQHWA